MARLTCLKPSLGALPSRLPPPAKTADPFYTSPAWRELSAQSIAEAGRCAECGSTHKLIADHKVEIKDGGAALDPGNIQVLCTPCHNTKTALARRMRAAGLPLTGRR